MPLDLSRLQNVHPSGDGWVAACPYCRASGGDSTGNHLRIWKDGAYNCVVSGSDKEHNAGIYALAGINGDPSLSPVQYVEEEPKIEVPRVWPASLLDRLLKDNSYWNGRGISDETLAPFRGGVATTGIMADRYVFPQFNEAGEIIGFSGRCLRSMSDEDRKRFGRRKWKHKSPSSTFLWGGLDEIVESRRAVLVESIGDGLALREHGVPESLCLFGTVMSETVLGYLISANPASIIVSTNLDQPKMIGDRMRCPGQEAAVKAKRILDSFFDAGIARIVHPPEGVKDWGDASAEQIAAAFQTAPQTPAEQETESAQQQDDPFATAPAAEDPHSAEMPEESDRRLTLHQASL